MHSILKQKTWVLFLALIILNLGTFISLSTLESDNLFYNEFANQFSSEQINVIISNKEKYGWVAYIFLPLILTLKLVLISCSFFVGVFFLNIKASFTKIIKVVIVADFLFIIPILIKLIWFSFFNTEYSLKDVQYFYPLSVLNLVDYNLIDKVWIYPFQLINVFEFLYIFLIAYILKMQFKIDFDKSLSAVLLSYVPVLFMLMVISVFLSLLY